MPELFVGCFNLSPFIVPNELYDIVCGHSRPLITCANVPKLWVNWLRFHSEHLENTGFPVFYNGETAVGCRVFNDAGRLVHIVFYVKELRDNSKGWPKTFPFLSIVQGE
jgi:hypothetical protein